MTVKTVLRDFGLEDHVINKTVWPRAGSHIDGGSKPPTETRVAEAIRLAELVTLGCRLLAEGMLRKHSQRLAHQCCVDSSGPKGQQIEGDKDNREDEQLPQEAFGKPFE
jgi:hypothetical protein